MQHATVATLATPNPTSLKFHTAAFLARYTGRSRDLYALKLRLWFEWCETNELNPITGITRPILEVYARHLEDERGNKPSSVANSLTVLKMFYRLLAIDGHITVSPAEYLRMPMVQFDETRLAGLTRAELGAFISTARAMSPERAALAVLLGLLGLRVSEAINVRVEDFQTYERGHRVLKVLGKGNKPATIPLPPFIFRILDACAGDRLEGVLVRGRNGQQLTPGGAGWITKYIATKAGIEKSVHPHLLRHTFVTLALEAGISLRDVQIAARHSDPKHTMRYDRARRELDRHAAYPLTAYVAGAAA